MTTIERKVKELEKSVKEVAKRMVDFETGNIRHLKQIAEIIQDEMKEEILDAVNVFLKSYLKKTKKIKGKK